MNRLNRRSFFGWLTGFVASLFGVKAEKAVEPELPWYFGGVTPESVEAIEIGTLRSFVDVGCIDFSVTPPRIYTWNGTSKAYESASADFDTITVQMRENLQ